MLTQPLRFPRVSGLDGGGHNANRTATRALQWRSSDKGSAAKPVAVERAGIRDAHAPRSGRVTKPSLVVSTHKFVIEDVPFSVCGNIKHDTDQPCVQLAWVGNTGLPSSAGVHGRLYFGRVLRLPRFLSSDFRFR